MFASLSVAFIIEFVTLTSFMTFYWMQGKISTGEAVQLFYTIWNLSMVAWIIADKAPDFFQSIGIAKQALCDEFIKKCPDRYNTLVGERGTKLSGGEK